MLCIKYNLIWSFTGTGNFRTLMWCFKPHLLTSCFIEHQDLSVSLEYVWNQPTSLHLNAIPVVQVTVVPSWNKRCSSTWSTGLPLFNLFFLLKSEGLVREVHSLTPLLKTHQWLSISFRINLKLFSMTWAMLTLQCHMSPVLSMSPSHAPTCMVSTLVCPPI